MKGREKGAEGGKAESFFAAVTAAEQTARIAAVSAITAEDRFLIISPFSVRTKAAKDFADPFCCYMIYFIASMISLAFTHDIDISSVHSSAANP